jgi:hypothetical protein
VGVGVARKRFVLSPNVMDAARRRCQGVRQIDAGCRQVSLRLNKLFTRREIPNPHSVANFHLLFISLPLFFFPFSSPSPTSLFLPSVDPPSFRSLHSSFHLTSNSLSTTTVFSLQWFASLASLRSPLLLFLPSLVTSFDTGGLPRAG